MTDYEYALALACHVRESARSGLKDRGLSGDLDARCDALHAENVTLARLVEDQRQEICELKEQLRIFRAAKGEAAKRAQILAEGLYDLLEKGRRIQMDASALLMGRDE